MGLHAFREAQMKVKFLLIAIIGLNSCSGANIAFIDKPEQVVEKNLVDLSELATDPVFSNNELKSTDFKYLYSFDEDLKGFIREKKHINKYVHDKQLESYFYFTNEIFSHHYGSGVAPNQPMPVYSWEGNYFSVYFDKMQEYHVISSSDMINWKLTEIQGKLPILFFKRDDSLLTINGKEIFNLSNNKIDKVQTLEEPIMQELFSTVYYSYQIEHYLCLHIVKDSAEKNDQSYHLFMTIDLNNFSYKTTKVAKENELIGTYNYKVVKTDGGWRILYVPWLPKYKIQILNPFAEKGPELTATNESVRLPTSPRP